MEENLQDQYARNILEGLIDPFKIDFEEFAKEKKKAELIIAFEGVGEDTKAVEKYLLEEDEEFLLEDLRGAWRSQDYLDVAESMLFDELDVDMAKIVVNKALSMAESSEDYVNIAELFIEEFNDKEKAREAYKKGCEVAKETSDLTFVADSVVDVDYLGDKEWAREIYQEALTLAASMYDFVYVARSIATPEYLDDKEGAKEVLDVAKGIANQEDYAQMARLGQSYALYTDDKESAKHFIVKALNACGNFEQFFAVLSSVAVGEMDEEFFKKIMKITLLSMEEQNQKDKVADLVDEYLGDEKLAAFLRKSSAEEIITLYSKKDLEDLKLEYARKILSKEIDPSKTTFPDFAKA